MKKTKIILDVDMGVDDAAALAWLLTREQIEVTGIATVVGNTTPEKSTNNALNILGLANHDDIEVVIGADEPLYQVASRTSSALHGPDGLWGTGAQHPQDLSRLSRDVADFYNRHACPDVTIIALGPLTNLALAVKAYPDLLRAVRIIILCGSKESSSTHQSSFNIWFDPEAAAQVLAAGASITLIAGTRKFSLSQEDIDMLRDGGTALGQFLAGPLRLYAQAQRLQGRSETFVAPDIVAAVYAVDPSVGKTQPALVRIAQGIFENDANRLLRGKVTMGIEMQEKLSMIADDIELSALVDRMLAEPDIDLEAEMRAILAREPDNAQIVLDIDADKIHELFMQPFTSGQFGGC
ncbi:MAG: nucleoside hydrolase [Anaerolineae bacterium]|nr:nucleoside hydrolase [Anaerolineae bacterium]